MTKYTYDKNNRLTKQGDEICTYDDNGSLIHQYNSTRDAVYTYNLDNKLIKPVITEAAQVMTEKYKYDWEGNRIGKTVNEVDETKYIVESNCSLSRVLAELDGANNVKTTYTYGDEIISLHRDSGAHYYLFDGHGSVRMLADENQAITDTYSYDAFGNMLDKTGDTENSYLYCGEQYDANTVFYYCCDTIDG